MLAKPSLFLSSYSPLFALLAVRFTEPWLRITCLGLALAGLGALLLLLRLDKRASAGSHRLTDVREAGGEAAAYLATYLLPLLTVTTPSILDLIAYTGFLAVAAVVHTHTSVLQVNPLLFVLGFKVLEIRDDQNLRSYLVTRRNIDVGDLIFATRFDNSVLIDRT